jgi:hypothetical protein
MSFWWMLRHLAGVESFKGVIENELKLLKNDKKYKNLNIFLILYISFLLYYFPYRLESTQVT